MNRTIEAWQRGLSALSAGLVILAAAALPQPARAANTVTLSGATGNNCTFTEVKFTPTLDYTFTCTGGAPSPGTIAFSPTVYAGNVNTTGVPVTLTRTGGTAGAVGANVTSNSAACTIASGSPVAFADGDNASKTVMVNTGAAPGSCTLSLSGATGGASLGASASFSVNDPSLPGTFSFATGSSNASTGVTTHTVTVSRVGGTAGSYSVAFTEVQTGVTGYSTGSSSVAFAAGQTVATIQIANTGTTSGTVAYTLGAVTPTSGGPATTAAGTHTVNVTAAASGSCPAPPAGTQTLSQLPLSGSALVVTGSLGSTITLPISPNAFRVRVFNTAATPGGFGASFGVSTCPGMMYDDWPQTGHVTDLVNGHIGGCRKTTGYTGNSLDISGANQFFPPICWITPAERAGGYYMTIRIDGCSTQTNVPLSSCEFYIQVD